MDGGQIPLFTLTYVSICVLIMIIVPIPSDYFAIHKPS